MATEHVVVPGLKPKAHLATSYLAFGDAELRTNAAQTNTKNKLSEDEQRNRTPNTSRTAKRRRISVSKDLDDSTDDNSDSNYKPRRSERARQQPKAFSSFSPSAHGGSARVNRAHPKSRTAGRPSYPLSVRSQLDIHYNNAAASKPVIDLPRIAELPPVPVFRPSHEEWLDPMAYIRSITPQCRAAGLCKIIPPDTWSPPFCLDSRRFSFSTREQNLHELQAGSSFTESDKSYTLGQFQQLAEQFKQHFRRSSTNKFVASEIEKEYWSIVDAQSPAIQVEYGADLDSSTHGSGFEPLVVDGDILKNDVRPYADSIGWNLRALPLIRGSLLGLLKEHVSGVSTPWLYVGMLFSSFCWQTEDSYLYSMNYLHCGAGKSWYSVGGDSIVQMEDALQSHHSHLFHNQPNFNPELVLQMDPHILPNYDVQPYHCVQYPGEFIVTFPAAHHCGFSHGFNVGEAVNFALDLWLPYGRMALNHYRQLQCSSIFSFSELLVSMAKQASPRVDFDIEIFLPEFDLMIQIEKEGRTKALELGVRRMEHVSATSHNTNTSSTNDTSVSSSSTRITCAICSDDCYLSHVSCSRCRTPAVCLSHIEYACQCENYDKVSLNYSFSIQQLQQMRQEVAKHRQVAVEMNHNLASNIAHSPASHSPGISTDFVPSLKDSSLDSSQPPLIQDSLSVSHALQSVA